MSASDCNTAVATPALIVACADSGWPGRGIGCCSTVTRMRSVTCTASSGGEGAFLARAAGAQALGRDANSSAGRRLQLVPFPTRTLPDGKLWMTTQADSADTLADRVEQIAAGSGAARVAVALHDYASGVSWSRHGGEWFHAASTIKIPILCGVFAAIEADELSLGSRVQVRNRFFSATDGAPYRIEPGRDANSEVHAHIGKTMRVRELAFHMIVTSSNLATNLLLDLVGTKRTQRTLDELGAAGVELRRGVEDEAAFREGVNNQVTAEGLVRVLRLIEEKKAVSESASDEMLDILHQQEFRSGIPAGLPDHARVANKTGEISTVAHDAGLVYLPDREPYALAVLTEWKPDRTSGRRDTIAEISRAVYQHLAGDDAEG